MAKRKRIKRIVKDKNGKFRYSGIIWAVFAVWAVYMLISQQISLQEQKQEIADISEKIETEERKNEELNATLDMVGTDEYVEKVARQNLGYTMSNEQVFVDSSKTGRSNQ